jgi:hypothetical protein
MNVYVGAVLSNPEIKERADYLVGVNYGWCIAFLWVNDCSGHEEARSVGMRELPTEGNDAEYVVVGPCNDECACGKVRGKSYFKI